MPPIVTNVAAGAEPDAGDLLDVVRHRVAMLGPVREADQDHEGGFREPPEIFEVGALSAHGSSHVIRET